MPRSAVCLVELEMRLITHSTVLLEAGEGTASTGREDYQVGLCQASCNIDNDTYIAMNFMLTFSQTIWLIFNGNKCLVLCLELKLRSRSDQI